MRPGVLAEVLEHLAFLGLLLFLVGVPCALLLIGSSR